MLELDEIRETVEHVAMRTFDDRDVDHVEVEPTVDSVGEDALRIVIVLSDGVPDRVSGYQFLEALVAVRDDLQAAGELRLPILEYATPAELELDRRIDLAPGY